MSVLAHSVKEQTMKRAVAAPLTTTPRNLSDPKWICQAPETKLQALPPPIREIARLCNGHRDVGQIAKAAQISESKCAAVIKKLTDLSILHPSAKTADRQFTEAEEAFFATEVGPIDECDEPFEPLGERVRAALCEVMARIRRQHVLG